MSVPEMTLMRDMWKLYGTYIVFSVHGRAGKFDIVTTLTQLGAGLSFLAFATLVSQTHNSCTRFICFFIISDTYFLDSTGV